MALLLLLLCGAVRGGGMAIVSSSANRSLVEEGGSVELSCSSDRPWFLCLWRSPRGDKQCAIQEDGAGGRTSSVCQGDPRVELEGGPTNCTIRLRGARAEDWGAWMCLLQDGQQFQTDRRLLELEVARRGWLELVVGGAPVEGPVLRLTEGETVAVECRVEGAFPRPALSWQGPRGRGEPGRVGREVGRPGEGPRLPASQEELWSEGEHSFSASSVVTYTARADHSNSSLACSVLQGEQLFPQRAALLLQISAPAPPSALLPSKTGLILGSSLAALLLLLLVLLLAVFLCRGRAKRGPTPPPASVWTSGVEDWSCPGPGLNSTFESGSIPEYADLSCSTSRSEPSTLEVSYLQETHFPSSELPPPYALATRSEGWPSLASLLGGLASRPASAPGDPLSLPSQPPTPPCAGSRASVFHCRHRCFLDSSSCGHTTEGSTAPEDEDMVSIVSLSQLVRRGLDLGLASSLSSG
jgi:hypothetical protein